jgi:hypothetical protein
MNAIGCMVVAAFPVGTNTFHRLLFAGILTRRIRAVSAERTLELTAADSDGAASYLWSAEALAPSGRLRVRVPNTQLSGTLIFEGENAIQFLNVFSISIQHAF